MKHEYDSLRLNYVPVNYTKRGQFEHGIFRFFQEKLVFTITSTNKLQYFMQFYNWFCCNDKKSIKTGKKNFVFTLQRIQSRKNPIFFSLSQKYETNEKNKKYDDQWTHNSQWNTIKQSMQNLFFAQFCRNSSFLPNSLTNKCAIDRLRAKMRTDDDKKRLNAFWFQNMMSTYCFHPNSLKSRLCFCVQLKCSMHLFIGVLGRCVLYGH